VGIDRSTIMTQEQSHKLVSLFYAHLLHVDEVCHNPEDQHNAMLNLCTDILEKLKLYSVQEIIDIIKTNYEEFPISSSDISQFSDLIACVHKTPYLIIASKLKDISYRQMGYLLLQSPKKEAAYIKYGENQAKTAAQIGLCSVDRGKINISYMGIVFTKLTEREQQELTPKLLLYIPIIQNYFAANRDTALIQKYLNQLSVSTQERRMRSINTLIEHIEQSCK